MSFVHTLQTIVQDRQARPQPGSYTAQLFAKGQDEIIKKVGEEAIEVLLAAKGQGPDRLVAEVADLVYHTLVLLTACGLTFSDVEAELERRHAGR
jgi:phosphoribosyl-ATP pyrophosphohydrolase